MRHISGDLIALAKAGQFHVIAHGCNCQHTMGAGLAAAIRTHFPGAYEADLRTALGDRTKLGTCSVAVVRIDDHELHVVNAYTQYGFHGPGVLVDYDAVRRCMAWIGSTYAGQRIGLPLIGAGLAGGDWQTIQAIIRDTLVSHDVTIVTLPPKA